MLGRAWILAVVLGSPWLVSAAQAQCVTIDPVVVPDLRLDPLDATGSTQRVQPVTLRFRRIGDIETPLSVTYQIVDEDTPADLRVGMNGGPLIDWRSNDAERSVGVSREQIYSLLRSDTVTFAAAQPTRDVVVRLFLRDLTADLPAGRYREQYTVRLWCGDPTATVANEASGLVSVAIQVPNVLSASIAGASNRGELDFGDFTVADRALSILVRSTGPYTVAARSQNGQALQREGTVSAAAADRIAYRITFDGQELAVDRTVDVLSGRAGLAGRQVPLRVLAEDVSAKRAGRYHDVLTLTLAPGS